MLVIFADQFAFGRFAEDLAAKRTLSRRVILDRVWRLTEFAGMTCPGLAPPGLAFLRRSLRVLDGGVDKARFAQTQKWPP